MRFVLRKKVSAICVMSVSRTFFRKTNRINTQYIESKDSKDSCYPPLFFEIGGGFPLHELLDECCANNFEINSIFTLSVDKINNIFFVLF